MRWRSSRLFPSQRYARTRCVRTQSIKGALPSFSGNVGASQIGGIEREAKCSEELRIPAQ
jgi:hypothetical protein